MTIIELCELDIKCNVDLHFEHFLLLVVTMAAILDISTRVLQWFSDLVVMEDRRQECLCNSKGVGYCLWCRHLFCADCQGVAA